MRIERLKTANNPWKTQYKVSNIMYKESKKWERRERVKEFKEILKGNTTLPHKT